MYNGGIYVSSNFGSSWSLSSAPIQYWVTITSSDSGQYLAAATSGYDGLYLSSNFGSTWTANDELYYPISSIASSSSGQYLVAGTTDYYYVYVSSDYGSIWSEYDFGRKCTTVACSGTGQYIVGSCYYTSGFYSTGDEYYLYVSSDYGVIWSEVEYLGTYSYSGKFAASYTGQYMYLVMPSSDPIIYSSSNYGQSWTSSYLGVEFNYEVVDIASSSSGQYLALSLEYGAIYLSSDFGSTWSQSTAPSANWYSIASSSNGTFLAAVVDGGYIYISQPNPTSAPTVIPTAEPTAAPTRSPTAFPTTIPTTFPTTIPTTSPTTIPTTRPTTIPSASPTAIPTAIPTTNPTAFPQFNQAAAVSQATNLAVAGVVVGMLALVAVLGALLYFTYYLSKAKEREARPSEQFPPGGPPTPYAPFSDSAIASSSASVVGGPSSTTTSSSSSSTSAGADPEYRSTWGPRRPAPSSGPLTKGLLGAPAGGGTAVELHTINM